MDVKKTKSIDSLKERIENLDIKIEVPIGLDYMTVLLKNKPPQYMARFAIWARDTLSKEDYMFNLVQSCVTKFATEALVDNPGNSEEFARGQVSGALFVFEEMERLSNMNEVKSDKNKN